MSKHNPLLRPAEDPYAAAVAKLVIWLLLAALSAGGIWVTGDKLRDMHLMRAGPGYTGVYASDGNFAFDRTLLVAEIGLLGFSLFAAARIVLVLRQPPAEKSPKATRAAADTKPE